MAEHAQRAPVPRHVFVVLCPTCGPIGVAGKKVEARQWAACGNDDGAQPHEPLRIEGYVPERRELRFAARERTPANG